MQHHRGRFFMGFAYLQFWRKTPKPSFSTEVMAASLGGWVKPDRGEIKNRARTLLNSPWSGLTRPTRLVSGSSPVMETLMIHLSISIGHGFAGGENGYSVSGG